MVFDQKFNDDFSCPSLWYVVFNAFSVLGILTGVRLSEKSFVLFIQYPPDEVIFKTQGAGA